MHVNLMYQLKGVNMRIEIQIKNQYGNTVAYPVCHAAKLFARIAGTKTLPSQALKDIQALGYEIVSVNPLTLESIK